MRAAWWRLWQQRGFVRSSVIRDFQGRYRRSSLGALWVLLQPVAMIVVYTLVFAEIMQARLSGVAGAYGYGVFICAGMLVWNYFSELSLRCQSLFVDHANLLKKLQFPRTSLVVIALATATLQFSLVFGLFTLLLLALKMFPGWPLLGLIPVIALVILIALGTGLWLGVLHVFFRDVGPFFAIALTFWFWLTPIVYPLTALPPTVASWVSLNPLTPLVGAAQDIMVYARWPNWTSLLPALALGLWLCLMAWRSYQRHATELIDEL